MAPKFKAFVRAPNEWDAFDLTRRLRVRDREEAEAAIGPDVEGAIVRAVKASGDLCWVVCNAAEANRLVWITGCVKIGDDLGSPWLLGTDDCALAPKAITALMIAHTAEMRKTMPRLINFVDARNADSVRWLPRVGFTVDPPAPYGVAGLPFHRFTMGF